MSPDKRREPYAKLRVTTTIQFDEDQYSGLQKFARIQKTSLVQQVRLAVAEYLRSVNYLKSR